MNSLARFSTKPTPTWRAARTRPISLVVCLLLLAGVAGGPSAVAQEEEQLEEESSPATEYVSDDWRFTITPYLWAPSLNGDVTVKGLSATVDLGFDDIWDKLNFAGMIEAEARKKRWGLFINPLYVDLEDDSDALDATINLAAVSFGAYYRLGPWPLDSEADDSWPALVVDVYAGGRYTYLNVDLEGELFGILEVDNREEWLDPIIGVRTTWDLSPKWLLAFRGDVGGFGVESDFVWQASGVVGYRLCPSTRLFAGYRAIGWDYDKKSGFEWDMTLHGPVFGISWSF